MPSRREFMAVLGTTLAGALAGRATAASGGGLPGPRPRRGESILNVSRDMRAFGVANMTPDDPGVNATAILNHAISLAEPNGITDIIADPGTYYLPLMGYPNDPHYVVLNRVDGLTIDLQGSPVIVQGIAGNAMAWASALLATNCTALTLRNFSIDYDPLPFSQYDIVAPPDKSGTVTLTTQQGFQSLGAFSGAPDGSLCGFVFRDGVRLYTTSRFNVSNVSEMNASTGTVTLSALQGSAAPSTLHSGDVLVIAFRVPLETAAMAFVTPVGLTMQNVSIYSSGAVGVYTSAASSSVFSGVNIVPAPGTTRLVSTNADGISLGQAGPNNQIVDCTFISAQDDSVSVNSLTLGSIGMVTNGGMSIVLADPIQAGLAQMSTALFVDPDTCQVYGPPIGVTPVANTPTPTLNLSGPLPAGVVKGFLVFDADPAHRGQGLVVARNRVLSSCFARGMSFWGLSGVTIRGNYFNGTHMAGIDVVQKTATDDWICLPSDAVTVQANLLENCNQGAGFMGPDLDPEMAGAILVNTLDASYAPASAPVHTAITIQNNYVVNTPRAGLRLQSILAGSTGGNLVQLASPPVSALDNGPAFTLGSVTSDAAIQIAVSPVGGAPGDPVVPGGNAAAAVLTNAAPPAGPLTFLMVDSNGTSFTPVVTGTWPSFQFVIPSAAIGGVAGLQISTSGTAVARGGMFVAV